MLQKRGLPAETRINMLLDGIWAGLWSGVEVHENFGRPSVGSRAEVTRATLVQMAMARGFTV